MTPSIRRMLTVHRDWSRLWPGVGVLCLGLLIIAGCQKKPKVSEVGQAVQTGGIEIAVESSEVRYLEVVEDGQTYEYDEPVLALDVAFTNKGKDQFMYSPTHGTERMTEATSPLLYPAPEGDKPLPPKSKSPIKGVFLEKGHAKGQITQPTPIKPSETIRDRMLYEVPEAEQAELIFSVPPSMHRGNLPVLFRFSYEYNEPKGPDVYSVGEAAEIEGVTLKVTSAEHAYIETKHPEKGKGYSANPLFRVKYKITNETDEAITYDPGHSALSGRRTEALYADDEAVSRVTFKSSDKVPGWVTDSKTIQPSKTIEDMSLFESPGKEVSSVQFEYPATRFERAGLVRVKLDDTYQKPEKPEPLRKSEDGEDE